MVALVLFPWTAEVQGEWDPGRLSPEPEGSTDVDAILHTFHGDPIDINGASRRDLETLGFFSEREIDLVLAGRPWRSLDDVRRSLALAPLRAELLEALFYIPRRRSQVGAKARVRFGSVRVGCGIEEMRVLSQLRAQPIPRVRVGWVQEKDPGEVCLRDHAAGYLEVDDHWKMDRLILGDFTLRFGQGILLWPDGPSMLDISRLARSAGSGRGFSGTSESGHLRGLFVHRSMGRWKISGFFSDRRVDARVDESGRITGFPTTGYHRSGKELSEKDRARHRLVGGRVCRVHGQAQMGLTVYHEAYSADVLLGDRDRDGVRFRGRRIRRMSSDWQVRWGDRTLFGEVTLDRRPSFVVGFSETRAFLEVVLWVRRLQPFLHLPNGSLTVVRRAALRNEEGVVFGLRVRPWPAVRVSVVADLESRLWRTWNQPLPPQRTEVQFEGECVIRGLRLSAEWKTTVSPYLERGEARAERRALRVRLALGPRLRFSCDLKESTSSAGRATLGRAAVTVTRGRWRAAASWIVVWAEPGAPSVSAYAPSLPGEIRFMQAARSGSGSALVVAARVFRSLEITLHHERSRFRSAKRWIGAQADLGL